MVTGIPRRAAADSTAALSSPGATSCMSLRSPRAAGGSSWSSGGVRRAAAILGPSISSEEAASDSHLATPVIPSHWPLALLPAVLPATRQSRSLVRTSGCWLELVGGGDAEEAQA